MSGGNPESGKGMKKALGTLKKLSWQDIPKGRRNWNRRD